MKCLIVDDSMTMRKIVAGCLKDMNVEIVEASDGAEALDKLEKGGGADIILTDWNMPNMNGLEFLRKVKEHPSFKSIPVVMVTTESEKQSIIEAVKNGASNYIVKPFTPDIIKAKITQTLSR